MCETIYSPKNNFTLTKIINPKTLIQIPYVTLSSSKYPPALIGKNLSHNSQKINKRCSHISILNWYIYLVKSWLRNEDAKASIQQIIAPTDMEIAYKVTGGKCRVATKKEIAWSATGG